LTVIFVRMGSRKYYVIFHAISCGLNGGALGSDEQDIVLIVYLVLDIINNKILKMKKLPVRPAVADVNENFLPDEVRTEFGLSDYDIKCAGSLRNVIEELDRALRVEVPGGAFTIITDGQLHLRQALYPEAYRKNITLPAYYQRFHDLRKEFKSLVSSTAHQENLTVEEMVRTLGLPPQSSTDQALGTVNNMARVVQKLQMDGLHLHEPEPVHLSLMQGIRSKSEQVDTNCVVRARGLPWQASDTDIARFFIGLNLAPGGVALCLSAQGRRNGEALVLFESCTHRDMALKRHKHHIGTRYIEVYKATGDDFIQVAGGNNTEAKEFLARGGQVIVRMRGLPYDCTAKQVIEFFENGDDPSKVLDNDHGVLFVKKPDGRSTGDAFVLFREEGDGEKALSKHKELIGSRYIELFRSTTAEVQQVLNRSTDPPSVKSSSAMVSVTPPGVHTSSSPLISSLPPIPQIPLIPQQLITQGTNKDCIRLRGLPYEAQVEHILEFLGDYARNIVVQGVHMVFNAQGQPSGEAFIQMDSEPSATSAANNRHNRYMVIGKKQRYIEVLQCSGEDMSLVLTGGLVPPATPTKSPLISPGNPLVNPHPSFASTPLSLAGLSPSFPGYAPPQLLYWPYPTRTYPSPPLSPSGYFSLNPHLVNTIPTRLPPQQDHLPPPKLVI